MIVAHNEVGPHLISESINDSLLRLRLSIYLWVCRDKVYSSGWPGTDCVDQDCFELTLISPPQLPGCWDYRCESPHPGAEVIC